MLLPGVVRLDAPARSNRSRLAIATLAACVLAACLAPSAGASRGQESPPLAAARARLAEARARAEAAAHEYERAHTDLAALDAEIARVESELPLLRARAGVVRSGLRERAADMYKRGSAEPLVTLHVIESGTLLAAARTRRLARAASWREEASIEELDALTSAWDRYQGELERRRERQAQVVDAIATSAAELDAAMAEAALAVREIEEAEAVAAYLRALAAEREAASRPEPPPPPAPAPARRPPPDDADELAGLVPVEELVCPIDGPVVFTNDWGNPRPDWRVHEGTDVFAARGTRNVAVADGLLRRRTGGIGGNAVWLEADEGTHYYYAHLHRFEGEFDRQGTRRVAQGEVVGYTGSTGNASGGAAHTHFEVHPGGRGAVNPYRMLRVMCAEQTGRDGSGEREP